MREQGDNWGEEQGDYLREEGDHWQEDQGIYWEGEEGDNWEGDEYWGEKRAIIGGVKIIGLIMKMIMARWERIAWGRGLRMIPLETFLRGRDTSVNCMVLSGDRDQFSRMLGQLFQDLDLGQILEDAKFWVRGMIQEELAQSTSVLLMGNAGQTLEALTSGRRRV